MEEKINFVKWLGQKKSLLLKEGLFAIIFFVTFALYHLPLAAIFYPVLLCFVTGMLFLVWDYRKFAVRHERLQQLSAMPFDVMTDFPESVSVLETDYQQIIVQLQEGQRRMKDEMSFQYQDMMDYYRLGTSDQNTDCSYAADFAECRFILFKKAFCGACQGGAVRGYGIVLSQIGHRYQGLCYCCL